jgi:hypothetical protein
MLNAMLGCAMAAPVSSRKPIVNVPLLVPGVKEYTAKFPIKI